MAAGKVAVIGTADAVELKERIEARAKKPVQIVSADAGPPKKDKEMQKEKKVDGGGSEKKADNERVGNEKKADKEKGGGGEKKADKEKGADNPKEETVTLKIHLHCDACIYRIKRRIKKIKGVKEIAFDAAKELVKVTGTTDTAAMQAYLREKLALDVEIVAPGKDTGAGDASTSVAPVPLTDAVFYPNNAGGVHYPPPPVYGYGASHLHAPRMFRDENSPVRYNPPPAYAYSVRTAAPRP